MQVKESREKIIKALTGRVQCKEERQKRRKAFLAHDNPMSNPEVRKRQLEGIRRAAREKKLWMQKPESRARISEIEKRLHAEGKKSSPALRPEVVRKISESLKGKVVSEERRMKQSRTMKQHYASGRMTPPSKLPEARKKLSESAKRRMALIPKDELSRRGKKMRSKARFLRPTSPERLVMTVCEKYGIMLKYVGNGKFWLEHYGRKLNPDFIASGGRRLIVEVFGDYWHREDAPDIYATEKCRRAAFDELGYRLLVLWQSHLDSMSEIEIAEKLTAFLNSE